MLHAFEGAAQLEHGGGIGGGQSFGQGVRRERARQHGEDLVAFRERKPQHRRGAADGRDTGDDLGPEPARQSLVHVHVGPVEKRVALGEQDHVPPGVEVHGESGRAVRVELVDGPLVAARVVGVLGGHRVDEGFFDLPRPQVRLGDRSRDAPAVAGAVVCDHLGSFDQPGGFDRHQLRIAGAETHAEKRAFAVAAHSSSLAIALMAATAMALPPRRPCTTK